MPLFDFPLVEATITLPFSQFTSYYTTDSVPSPLPVTQQVIANINNAASLSACYIEYWGLGLYYLDSPSSTGKPNTTPATITQLYWNETELWSPTPTPLNAKAFNSGAALTAACVTEQADIHILYMNEENVLTHFHFSNETWTLPSVVPNTDNKGPLSDIANMVAIIPSVDLIELNLYYLDDHRPQQTTLITDELTGLIHLSSAPSSFPEMPDAIQAPPLIAAATRLHAVGEQPQLSVFYVWRSNATYMENAQGSVVLNMTTVPGETMSWVQDGWPMEG